MVSFLPSSGYTVFKDLSMKGGTGYSVISKHSAVMLIVGGSGVTFALSTILDIMQREENCGVQVIHVVWCVPTSGTISSVLVVKAFTDQAVTVSKHFTIDSSLSISRRKRHAHQHQYEDQDILYSWPNAFLQLFICAA